MHLRVHIYQVPGIMYDTNNQGRMSRVTRTLAFVNARAVRKILAVHESLKNSP